MRVDSLSVVVAELESGKRPKGGVSADSGTIPSLGGEHLNKDGTFVFDNLKYIDEDFFRSLKKGAIKQNDILIVKDGATTGKVSFVGSDFPFKRAAINEHLFSLRVNTAEADPKYVFLFLKSPQGQKQILKDFRGAAIGGISRGFVDLAEIPLPPLDEQKQIAHLLSKVEGLVAQRKQHLQQLDDLLKSVFLEMFGDPVRNERGHKLSTLGPFITHLTSGGRGWAKYYSRSGKRFIRSLDVQMNRIGSDDIAYVDPPGNKETERTKVQPGDVLLTITGSKIGRVCYVPIGFEEAYVSQHVAIIRTRGINPIYLSYYMSMPSCGQRTISKQQYGQAKPGLNLTQIRNFEILVPDPGLQDHFVNIVERIEGIKARYQQSVIDLENLYGSLSQKAFKGELDLSRVPIQPATGALELEGYASSVMVTPVGEQQKAIVLPDIGNMAEGVATQEGRKHILSHWLDSYLTQLKGSAFSVNDFLDAAQIRLADLHPDSDCDLGFDQYEQLKDWLFEALASGRLEQTYDDPGNRVQVIPARG